MTQIRRSLVQRYAFAVLSVLAALLLSLAVRSYLERIPFLMFVVAVLLSVWYGGQRPALMALGLSVPLVAFFLLPPYDQMKTDPLTLFWLSVFVATAYLIIAVHQRQVRISSLLYTQQEQFRVTLKSIGDAVIATDQHGLVTFMNSVAELLTGSSLAEAEGRLIDDVFKIVNEQTRAPVPIPVALVLREGRVMGLANRTILISKEGVEYPIDDSAAPIRDSAGNLIGTILVFRDISERRAAEQKERDHETKFRQMANAAPVLLWRTNAEREATYFNQGWLDFTGRTLEEELGNGWLNRIHPDDRQNYDEAFRSGALVGQPVQVEFRARRHDSTFRWILCSGAPRFTEDGRFDGYTSSCVDIHERRRLEDGLRFLQSITAALSEAVTPKQVGDVIIEKALSALGGHMATVSLVADETNTVEALSGTEIPPEVAHFFARVSLDLPTPLTDCVRTNTPIWIENSEECRARYPIIAEETISILRTQASACVPMAVKGEVIGGIGICFPEARTFSDDEKTLLLAIGDQCALAIDRARQYEAVEAAREEAERANALKVQFLGMISHELRTPLTPIKGFATTLLADDIVYDANDQRHYISIISEEADKLADLIDQLLDLSRLQAGTLGIRAKAESLNAVFELAAAQLTALSAEHPLQIEISENLPFIVADKRRVAQIITNLVSNAARYSPPGKHIQVRAQLEPSHIQVDVRDEGSGIPPEARQYVFEPFRRVEGRTAPKGAGLGLAICKGLVEAHGGSIWINDSSERGTTISFTLPLLAEPESETSN